MQSKLMSFLESSANTIIGIAVAWVVAMLIFPLYGYTITAGKALSMNLWFYAASLGRSYVLRRYFNRTSIKEQTA